MIKFNLKKVSENSPHYNITFTKTVRKRSGEEVEEAGESLYALREVKSILTNIETVNRFENQDVSLRDYMNKFHKVYKEICELLKKTS